VWSEQRVERTNARGRHTYCASFKAWIVGQALRPGMSLAGLAMRNQVNANQLRRWVMLHQRAWPAPAQALLPARVSTALWSDSIAATISGLRMSQMGRQRLFG
jgi:transposase-like protein